MSYLYRGQNQFVTALTLPDDSDTPNQANFSPGWEGNRDAAVYLYHRVFATALYNYGKSFVNSTSYGGGWAAFYWDNPSTTSGGATFYYNQRWVGVQIDSNIPSTATAFYVLEDGWNGTWVQKATTTTSFDGLLPHALSTNASQVVWFGQSSKVAYWTGSGSSITVATSAGWNATHGVAWFNATTNKNYMVGDTQSGATFTGAAASYAVSGPTITNLSGNLPVGWASGTNHTGTYYAANDGTHYLVLMGGVTAGTDTSRLLNAGDLSAPTDITPSFLTGKIGRGIAWDDRALVWVICAYDGTDSKFYTSTDRTVWTLTGTAFPSTKVYEFNVVGGSWVAVLDSYNPETSTATVFLSQSQGAVWERAQVTAPTSGGIRTGLGTNSMIFGTTTSIFVSGFVGAF